MTVKILHQIFWILKKPVNSRVVNFQLNEGACEHLRWRKELRQRESWDQRNSHHNPFPKAKNVNILYCHVGWSHNSAFREWQPDAILQRLCRHCCTFLLASCTHRGLPCFEVELNGVDSVWIFSLHMTLLLLIKGIIHFKRFLCSGSTHLFTAFFRLCVCPWIAQVRGWPPAHEQLPLASLTCGSENGEFSWEYLKRCKPGSSLDWRTVMA